MAEIFGGIDKYWIVPVRKLLYFHHWGAPTSNGWAVHHGPPAGDGPGYWLRGEGEGRPADTLFPGPTATEGPETEKQARNHLEAPWGRRVF